MDNLSMLIIIVNSSYEKKILEFIKKYKLGFKVVMHGMGTASSSILEYFGLKEQERVIILSVLPDVMVKNILNEIDSNIILHGHGKGIAFSIPLSSSTKYMVDFYKDRKMEDFEMKNGDKHLVVTIVNQGYAEKVMTEAKKAGATGGTTLSGRGLETERVVKFLNIDIEPEKDVVLILVSNEKKKDIMDSIVTNCGLKTKGAGICFSLPVDYVVGLNEELDI